MTSVEKPSRDPIDLSLAGTPGHSRGKSRFIEALWWITEFVILTNPLQPSSRLRAMALRLFGSAVGRHVILRPRLRVKYPWRLQIGDHSWIGEDVWLHNQDFLRIGRNVVISQGAFITTGSHETQRTMHLVTNPVTIQDGVWLTARCIVLSGTEVGRNAIVTPGSVVRGHLAEDTVYCGNPIRPLGPRFRDPHGDTEGI
jgi:putative colanic acid biosynthesis acetyltransferase WcaF